MAELKPCPYCGSTHTFKIITTEYVHATRYETLKKVEDTCRAMIASYEADKLTWEQYKDSDSEEKRGWADQAMMRANRTAATYNEYILKNSYVWKGNVPDDIRAQLVALGEAD